MASTNKTSNLELSQFIATDTPTWLVDYNGDMEKIDAGVGRVEELAETASTQAVGVASGLQATNQTVTTLSGQVANVQNQANSTTASVNGINQRLGNTDISGVGDGTITGAINAQNSILSNLDGSVSATLLAETQSNSPSNTITLSSDKLSNYRFLYLVNQSSGETLNIYVANFFPVNIAKQYNGYIAAETADKVAAVFSYISDTSFKLYITDALYKVSLYGIK